MLTEPTKMCNAHCLQNMVILLYLYATITTYMLQDTYCDFYKTMSVSVCDCGPKNFSRVGCGLKLLYCGITCRINARRLVIQ